MDRVNHLWPDIARLVPKKTGAVVAWLFACDATQWAVGSVLTMKQKHGLCIKRLTRCPASRFWAGSAELLRVATSRGHMRALSFLETWGCSPQVLRDHAAL